MTNNPVIPLASDLNYSDTSELCGYQLLLCKLYEQAGGFDLPHTSNSTLREVKAQARIWLREVKKILQNLLSPSPSLPAGEGVKLLSSYSFFHRVCHGTPDDSFIRQCRLRIADRWVRGDKSVSQTDVALELLKEVNRDNRTLEPRFSLYALSVLEKWIDELQRHGKFLRTTFQEAYSRLTFLINDDLFAFLGSKEQRGVKTRWISAHTLPTETLDTLDTPSLWSYIGFAQNAAYFQGRPLRDIDTQSTSLFTLLTSRPDLHPYTRAALRLSLP